MGDEWKLVRINPAEEERLRKLGLLPGEEPQSKRKRGRPRKQALSSIALGKFYLIKKGFNSNFQNSVLRIKVLALVSMLIQEKNIKDCFNEYNDLFIATSTVSYIQRHQQIHSFDKKQASIVVEEIFKFMNYVVNQNSIINFR